MLPYVATMYVAASDGIMYGPDHAKKCIRLSESVRQGGATSTYIFSRAMDVIIQRFQDVCRENGINVEDDDIFCYMDDLTVALKPEYDPRIPRK